MFVLCEPQGNLGDCYLEVVGGHVVLYCREKLLIGLSVISLVYSLQVFIVEVSYVPGVRLHVKNVSWCFHSADEVIPQNNSKSFHFRSVLQPKCWSGVFITVFHQFSEICIWATFLIWLSYNAIFYKVVINCLEPSLTSFNHNGEHIVVSLLQLNQRLTIKSQTFVLPICHIGLKVVDVCLCLRLQPAQVWQHPRDNISAVMFFQCCSDKFDLIFLSACWDHKFHFKSPAFASNHQG